MCPFSFSLIEDQGEIIFTFKKAKRNFKKLNLRIPVYFNYSPINDENSFTLRT